MKDVELGTQQIRLNGNPWRDEVNQNNAGEQSTNEFPENYVKNDVGEIQEGWPKTND